MERKNNKIGRKTWRIVPGQVRMLFKVQIQIKKLEKEQRNYENVPG